MSASTKFLPPDVLWRIHRLELRAKTVVEGFLAGVQKSPYEGFSVEFAEHREYVPGDDTRHIDWRVFAKADRYYIKEYEEETNLRTHIVLDASASMAYPDPPVAGRPTKWDYARTLAACVAHLLVHQHDAAGLLLFDSAVRRQIPPKRGANQIRSLIELIEREQPARETQVKATLANLADRFRRRGLVVLISDLLCPADDVIAGVERLRYDGHGVVVMQVLDHDEIEFPFTDNTMFDAMEPPEDQVLTDPQSLRQSYRRVVDRFVSRVRTACAARQADYVLVSTADPVQTALPRFLAQRMQSMRR
jgi:uncharacterized protein (DUF58 family)